MVDQLDKMMADVTVDLWVALGWLLVVQLAACLVDVMVLS